MLVPKVHQEALAECLRIKRPMDEGFMAPQMPESGHEGV